MIFHRIAQWGDFKNAECISDSSSTLVQPAHDHSSWPEAWQRKPYSSSLSMQMCPRRCSLELLLVLNSLDSTLLIIFVTALLLQVCLWVPCPAHHPRPWKLPSAPSQACPVHLVPGQGQRGYDCLLASLAPKLVCASDREAQLHVNVN